MAKTIQTVGQLREFLANVMLGVKDGNIKPAEAAQIQKTAAQINESFYSEIKVMKLRREMGQDAHNYATGDLPINKRAS